MSIRQLMWLNLIALLALTGLGSSVGYVALKNASEVASQIKPPDTRLQELQMEWQQQMLLMEQLVQHDLTSPHLITEDISGRLNQSFARETRLVDELSSRNSISPDLLAQLDRHLRAYHQARDQLLRQASVGSLVNVSSLYLSADSLLDFGAYLVSLKKQLGVSHQMISYHLSESASRLLFVFIFSAMVGLLIFLRLQRDVLNPILSATAQLQKLNESGGDLRMRLREDNTEIGQAAAAVNLFLENIQGLVAQLQTNSRALLFSSNHISDSVSRAAACSGIELTAISHIADALQKVSEAMAGVGEFAGRANEASGVAVDNTHSSNHVVVMAQQGVDQITTEVEQAFKSISDLLNESQHLGALQGTLQVMSAQISELALTAAIETARARDPARGLAPLVENVRQLAQRVEDLATALDENLGKLARGSTKAAELIAAVQKQATAIKGRVEKASTKLTAIVQAVDHIKTMNADIARVSDDEHQEITNIRDNMMSMLQTLRQNYSVGSEADMSRKNFEQHLVKMDGLLQRFRT